MKNKNIYVLAIVLLVVFSGYLIYKNSVNSKRLSIIQESFSVRNFLEGNMDQEMLRAKLENKYTNSTKNLMAQSYNSTVVAWCDELWNWYLENEDDRKEINSVELDEDDLRGVWTIATINKHIDQLNGSIFSIMGNAGCDI